MPAAPPADDTTEAVFDEEHPPPTVFETPTIGTLDGLNGKRCFLIDYNLFSGSADRFRNNVGGYYFNVVDDGGNIIPQFFPFHSDMRVPPQNLTDFYKTKNPYIDQVETFSIGGGIEHASSPDTTDRLIPNYKFVVSVNGDNTKVKSDKFWKTLWTGGTFDGIYYDSIFNNNAIFDDYHTAYEHAYPYIYKQRIKNPEAVTSYAQISTLYNAHLRDYQRYASEIGDERLLPSVHLDSWAYLYSSGASDPAVQYPPELYDCLSYDGQFERPEVEFLSMSVFLEEKLTVANPYRDKTAAWKKRKFTNFMFGDTYYTWQIHKHTQATASSLPFGATVKFQKTSPAGPISRIISDRDFSERFLVTLKEVFAGQSPVTVRAKAFEKNTRFLTSSQQTDGNVYASVSNSTALRYVDFHETLLHSYDNVQCDYDDFYIVGSPSLEVLAAGDKTGNYRHLNSSNSIETMKEITTRLYDQYPVKDLHALYNLKNQSLSAVITGENTTPHLRKTEVLAYRIDKLKSSTSGGTQNQEVIQTFWFFNSDWDPEIDFFDSQVKYGEEYTYNIYEYRCIQGLKYKYSNLQLTRVIGVPTQGGANEGYMNWVPPDDPDFNPAFYCIEYYDPYTGNTEMDLLNPNDYYGGGGLSLFDYAGVGHDWGGWYHDMEGQAQLYAGENSSLSSGAQRIARTRSAVSWPAENTRPYFANFLVTVEPRMKIYEIPLMTKTVKILDNPPNKVCVYPSYLKDSTQTLKFLVQYEGFAHKPYPHPITEADADNKAHYIRTDDLIAGDKILKETVSKHRTLEVYRLPYRPTSFRDFEGALIDSYDMIMDVGDYTYNDLCVYDRIPSGRKFYYAFRVLNENDVGGYLEEVLQAEFVSDGGYKYALFDTIFHEQMPEKTHTKVTKNAKKLFQLSPATAQSALYTENADFTKTAQEEYDGGKIRIGTAKDLIWNKTFKVRLTSKKSGKKIDLNITYRYISDILGTE